MGGILARRRGPALSRQRLGAGFRAPVGGMAAFVGPALRCPEVTRYSVLIRVRQPGRVCFNPFVMTVVSPSYAL